MDHLEIVKRWTINRENGACAPGLEALLHTKTLEEAYQQYSQPEFFLFRICRTSPQLCYKAVEHCFEKIPVNDHELQLKNSALDPAASNEELTERMTKLTAESKTNSYLRALFYMVRWRLGLQDAKISVVVVKKLREHLRQSQKASLTNLLLVGYLRETITFKAWVESIEDCMKVVEPKQPLSFIQRFLVAGIESTISGYKSVGL